MKLKKLSALLAAGLLCLTAVTGCSQTPAAPEQEATPTSGSDVTTMRVATWNIDSKAHPDIKEMSNIIHERGIEIMGFQEIDILNTRNDYDMAQDFVNDNYPYVHFAKGRDFADGYFGVGTTSSLEFQEDVYKRQATTLSCGKRRALSAARAPWQAPAPWRPAASGRRKMVLKIHRNS